MRRLSPTLRALVCLFLEYCMLLPALYVYTGLVPAAMAPVFLLSILAYGVIGVLTQRLIPSPLMQLVVGLPLCFGGALWLGLAVAGRLEPMSYAVPAIFAPLVFYRGRQHALNDWNAILPVYAPTVIMTLTFILLAFVEYLGSLEQFMPLLVVFGILSLIVSFFAMNHLNRRNLADDQRAGGKAAAISRRLSPQNITLLGVIMAVGFLLTCMPWLFDLIRALFRLVMDLVAWIFHALFDFAPAPASGNAGGGDDMTGMPVADPHMNPFWEIFFRIAVYIVGPLAAAAFVVLIILALRNGIRLIWGFLRSMLEQRGILTDQGGGFEDTHESLVQLRDLPRQYLDSLRSRMRRETRWNELQSESERVRYLYRHSLRRAQRAGYRHRASYTPKESLDEAAAALPQIQSVEESLRADYELVRYGESEPPTGDAERIRRDAGL